MSPAGPNLIIRPFRRQDQEEVQQLILDGLGDHFPVVDATLNPDLDDIAASYTEQGHAFIVAETAGRIVGAGALIGLDNQSGRIVRVSVAKSHRRRGIGAQIVAWLVEFARERQYGRLLVETNFDWLEAIALYQNCGFQPRHRDEVSLYMELLLSGAP